MFFGFITNFFAAALPKLASVTPDTVKTVASQAESASNGNWIIEHVADSHTLDLSPFGKIALPHFAPIHFAGLTIDMSPTKHVVMLWLVGVILFVIMKMAASSYKKSLIPGKFASALELLIIFVRDEIVIAAVGEKGRRLLPYFLTLFFFILFSNLFGMVPYASTPTGNINVTASLAIIAFFVIQISGIIQYGIGGYFKGLVPPGIPAFVIPVMVIVEVLGLFTKPFALCVRLFANMIAGHIVIFSLIGLIFIFGTIFIAPISVGFALFIDLLELLVATIQAYIFTMLTALFVGMAVHQEH